MRKVLLGSLWGAFIFSFLALVAISLSLTGAFAAPPDEEKELPAAAIDRIPGQYIVVLKEGTPDVAGVAREIAGRLGGEPGHTYSAALKGFVVRLPQGVAASRLTEDSRVKFIEQDGTAYAFDHVASEIPTGIDRINAELNSTTSAGTGLGVAVIDTGIQLNHSDLNVVGDVTFVNGTKNGNDDNGHGTHVAGTAGAKDNGTGVVGVSPAVDLYAVKVLSRTGSGSWSNVIKGIDWVAANANKISVANMSLGGSGSDDGNCGNTNDDAVNQAICGAVAKGVVFVVAAGNSAADSKDYRPAAYDEVITVSALADSDGKPNGTGKATSYGADDTFATFSNFGADVDLIAPGVQIKSTYLKSGTKVLSGTSMSAPHVTGTVALWIARNGRPATGDAKDPAVRDLIAQISESVGSFKGDPDGIAEPMVNADTVSAGGTGSGVCCPAP